MVKATIAPWGSTRTFTVWCSKIHFRATVRSIDEPDLTFAAWSQGENCTGGVGKVGRIRASARAGRRAVVRKPISHVGKMLDAPGGGRLGLCSRAPSCPRLPGGPVTLFT